MKLGQQAGTSRARARAAVIAAGLGAAVGWTSQSRAQDVTAPTDPIVGFPVNFPVAEGPVQVIDNTANTKYLNFGRLNTGFTVTTASAQIVRSLAIVTANDAPERDPASYILEGSNDGVNFSTIAQGALNPPTARRAVHQATFANETAYTAYRVTFPTIRTPASANSMQVAEVQLLTRGDIFTPGDAFTTTYTPGASSGANEGAANLFDERLGTKMGIFNGNFGPTTIDVTPGLGATTVTGIDIFSANDDLGFPGRTPSYVTLYGSLDNVNFTQIFTTGLTAATDNWQDQQYSFDNPATYRHYRIELGPSSAIFTQLSEIQLFGIAVALPPDNDDCANAIEVLAGTPSGGANFNASGADITACGQSDTTDVWFRYQAAASGLVEANTFGAGVLDTTLAVFTDCVSGTAIACDDNSRGIQSRVRWTATMGQNYFIRVAGVGGATGAFVLNVIDNPVVHNDISVPLAYNFNGMVHNGEAGAPDAPNGYRAISDRGLRITGAAGSLDVGLEGGTGIPYSVNTHAGQLDIVHLADRNTTDTGNWAFDTGPGLPDNIAGVNFIGVQPAWLGCTDQTGPQTTDTCRLGAVLGPDSQIGVIYQISNNGGFFDMTLGFDDGSGATVMLQGPDWFGDQQPGDALPGVEYQEQLGVYFGTQDVDLANTGVDLNVVEAIVSGNSLLNGLGVDITGRRLTSITFSNRSNTAAGYAILAATVRDPVSIMAAACEPVARGTSSGSPVGNDGTGTVHLSVALQPGTSPAGTGAVVTVDLGSLGGANSVTMFDDGQHDDGAAGDNVFGVNHLVPNGTAPGLYSPFFSFSDAQGRNGFGFICVEVVTPPPAPPGNDNCANAEPVSGPGTFPFDTTFATPDGPLYTCNGGGGTSGSVWFAYTRTPNTSATIETCGTTGFDTVMVAIAACGDPAAIICDDDACAPQSRIALDVGGAQTVLIRVSGWGANNVGAGSIVITETPGACRADFNGDTSIDPDDLADFITCFFLDIQFPGFCPAADFNGDTSRDPDDLADFITTFFLAVQFGC